MMARALTVLSTPSMKRWPVLRSSPPCRLSLRCTMWSTIQPHLPPLPLLRLHPLPHPPPPAWTHWWAAWMSRRLSLWLACLPVLAVLAPSIQHGTPCMCPKPSASSHHSPSCRLLDSFCLSCTRLWPHTRHHPSLWKATSIIFCMRCPCHLLVGRLGSMGCRDLLCASSPGRGSFPLGSIHLEKPFLCWVWTIWWNCLPVHFWRHKSCFTLKVSTLLCWLHAWTPKLEIPEGRNGNAYHIMSSVRHCRKMSEFCQPPLFKLQHQLQQLLTLC